MKLQYEKLYKDLEKLYDVEFRNVIELRKKIKSISGVKRLLISKNQLKDVGEIDNSYYGEIYSSNERYFPITIFYRGIKKKKITEFILESEI